MATRSFVNEAQAEEALLTLKKSGPMILSAWLGQALEARLSAHPLWQDARPYKLGSWSRGELCAKSDIDLLFIGPEEKVKVIVNDFQREGIRIRYRLPADLEDWTVNVEAFDVLALLTAVPFFSQEEQPLNMQRNLILKRGSQYKRKLFRAMMRERAERAKRYDSIATYLEPNLKYGHGGLRDLEQGLTIYSLYPEKFESVEVFKKLQELKFNQMRIRHFLHLSGAGDVLVSGLQQEAAHFFNFSNVQNFMSNLARDLSDVSFYADLLAEIADSKNKKNVQFKTMNIEEALSELKVDPTLRTQYLVRRQPFDTIIKNKKRLGHVFEKYFSIKMTDVFLQGLFRSQLLAKLIPNLERLRGHVQHDQYHRYTVDAHTLQAVREVLRVKKTPKRLGRLAKIVNQLTSDDWRILLWSALYHDLGKGLQGDHSSVGAEITKRDFINFGLSLELTRQVVWMVQNHLLLSGAAFRQNPHSVKTWGELFNRGVKGARLVRLAIFTAIDIRATNPEAWNDWKERLLFDLTQAMQSPKASRLSALLETAEKQQIKIDKIFIENLDPQVIESIPKALLLKDYLCCKKSKVKLEPLVLRNKNKEVWVRFHDCNDKPGLFLAYAKQLRDTGLGVQEAFVQTYSDIGIGVYDWFKVKSSKPTSTLRNMLINYAQKNYAQNSEKMNKPVEVRFQQIELISQDEQSVILSFRGKDQQGALLAAAWAINEVGLEIQSAKVHTWGRQIDDVFKIKKSPGLGEKIQNLRDLLTETKT